MNLITVNELADKIHSTIGTVYSWVSMRRIPATCIVKLGRKLLFDLDAVNQWLESCK